MRQFFIIILALILTTVEGKATKYKDYIISNNYIWGLTSEGAINFFEVSTGKRVKKKISNSYRVKILTLDNDGVPTVLDGLGRVKKYNSNENSWVTILKCDEEISAILFDSKGICYAITEGGILDVSANKKYFGKNSLNHQINFKEGWGAPSCYFIDKRDNIWLGFGFGEWGGELIVFNTVSKEFITPALNNFRISLWPIKSFFQDSSGVYLSAGLMHFSTSGIIVKFENFKATILFDSHIDGEYMGPATFNSFDNSIYFYSHNGIFRGSKTKDLSKIENWEKILQPKLRWKNGQQDAVGSPMNVFKLTCIDENQLVFLSQNDGIGFFHDKELTMLH